MKKLFITILILVLCTTGCSFRIDKSKEVEKSTKTIEEPKEVKEEYQDDNKMPISIYQDGNYELNRIDNYKTKFTLGTDIAVFQIFPSTEKTVKYKTRFADTFYEEWNKIDTNKTYKMAYHLSYTLKDGTNISHYIYSPKDTMKYKKYIKIYLYDDYSHRNDSWYSHITDDEYNDNTYMTSIKLTPGTDISKVNSSVELMAFTYNGEDDFENNEYRGISKDILVIENE